ncbi:MAG TPA: ABC transporter substrate-binding protein [Candidatus Dormibacteraeota bacterium]
MGVKVSVARIVSLVPGATESLYALGLGDRVAAVTHECDWPAAARALPRVTRSTLELDGLEGGDIDLRVAGAAERGDPLYVVDTAAIRRLEPDLVVAQDVCAVCAVAADEVVSELQGLRLLRQHPHTLEDVLQGIDELAKASDLEASSLTTRLRARIEAAVSAVGGRRVRGVFLEWLDPPYAAGHWTPDLLRAAGLEDPLARPGLPSVPITWEAVAAAEPEVLVLAPCGFDQARAEAEAGRLRDAIAATGCRREIVLDGSAYFNRPGPRLADSLEVLASELWADQA